MAVQIYNQNQHATNRWSSHEWESYAIGFWCDSADLAGAKEHCFSWQHMFSGVAGRASFFEDKERRIAVITFRGAIKTDNWANCMRCGSVDLTKINTEVPKEIKLHEGFAAEYVALKPLLDRSIMPRVEARSEEGWHILLTGNSMGGALATICAADLHFNRRVNRRTISLVTFGSPRTGNKEFALMINRAMFHKNIRVEIEGDCFAALPKQHKGDFWHRGELSLMNENFETKELPEDLRWERDDRSWSYICPGAARTTEDFFKAAGSLNWGLLGIPEAFKTHISYHKPYKNNDYNKAGLAVARGEA